MRRKSTAPSRRVEVATPPASGPRMPPLPAILAGPSMEAGQPPDRAGVPSGWVCPSCRRVYAPWVACCAKCGPEDASGRTEITET